MITVRAATAKDLPAYVDRARLFHLASPVRDAIKFDADGYADFYMAALRNPDIGMWLAESDGELVGIAGALLYGIYFSPSTRVAQELWWYLDPAARGTGAGAAMFAYIEQWASLHNAKAIFMIALEDERVGSMVKVYSRAGYFPTERTFMKEI